LTLGNNATGVLQQLPAGYNAGVRVVQAERIGNRKALTRRTRNNSIKPTANTGEFPHVAASDFVGDLNHAKTSVVKCPVKQTDTRKQGKNKSRHKMGPQNDN
jgi:hypothetical protein